MPVARRVRLVRSNPPPSQPGGVRLVQYTIYDIAYIHHIPYIEPPKLEIEPPPASEGGSTGSIYIIHRSNCRAGHWGLGTAAGKKINGARKIARTTPPLELRNFIDYPPRNRPGKSLQLPPVEFSNSWNFIDYPPPSKSARKIAPTTPPLEFTELHRLPPPHRNRPENVTFFM